QRTQEIAEIVGERMKLEPHCVGARPALSGRRRPLPGLKHLKIVCFLSQTTPAANQWTSSSTSTTSGPRKLNRGSIAGEKRENGSMIVSPRSLRPVTS